MNIELQVGKRYETRGGGWIAGITGRDEAAAGTDNEFLGYVEFSDGDRAVGRTWRADGRFSGDMESASDLIRELPDASSTPEPAAEPEPVSDTQAPLRLEVGKFYRARNGEIAEVREAGNGTNEYHAFSGKLSGHGIVQWAADGRYWEFGPDEWDLAEEIPAPVAEAVAEMEFETGPGTATDGPATEKVVAHWDRERFIGTEAAASTATRADDAWLRANLADTRAGIARKYAQAAMFVMLGVAAIIFAIGTSVQA